MRRIVVRTAQEQTLKSICTAHGIWYERLFSSREDSANALLSTFELQLQSTTNHKVSQCLTDLVSQGIAYDYTERLSSESSERTVHAIRFTSGGERYSKQVKPCVGTIEIKSLRAVLSSSMRMPQKLAQLEALVRKEEDFIAALSWDNQIEYGKRYRTNQLLKNNGEEHGGQATGLR